MFVLTGFKSLKYSSASLSFFSGGSEIMISLGMTLWKMLVNECRLIGLNRFELKSLPMEAGTVWGRTVFRVSSCILVLKSLRWVSSGKQVLGLRRWVLSCILGLGLLRLGSSCIPCILVLDLFGRVSCELVLILLERVSSCAPKPALLGRLSCLLIFVLLGRVGEKPCLLMLVLEARVLPPLSDLSRLSPSPAQPSPAVKRAGPVSFFDWIGVWFGICASPPPFFIRINGVYLGSSILEGCLSFSPSAPPVSEEKDLGDGLRSSEAWYLIAASWYDVRPPISLFFLSENDVEARRPMK
mmetsp:Transcript_14126/g.23907  ORF Transcript_14126/g.23907 Transcript_14126/m.23907 type:complete len:298 (+) Transcript_14126:515-1408(+)